MRPRSRNRGRCRWTLAAAAAWGRRVSSRGVGLKLDREVGLGDRVSLLLPLADGKPELRTTVEIRHVRVDSKGAEWRAGGLFRNLPSADHERVIRCIFAELRSRRTQSPHPSPLPE